MKYIAPNMGSTAADNSSWNVDGGMTDKSSQKVEVSCARGGLGCIQLPCPISTFVRFVHLYQINLAGKCTKIKQTYDQAWQPNTV